MAVVDLFEVVDVDEEGGGGRPVAARALDLGGEVLAQGVIEKNSASVTGCLLTCRLETARCQKNQKN